MLKSTYNLENVSVQYLRVYCTLTLHYILETFRTERAISNAPLLTKNSMLLSGYERSNDLHR